MVARAASAMNAASEAVDATHIDVAFPLQGRSVPRDHRRLLADALQRALPRPTDMAGLGVHRLNVAAGGGTEALLSGRTRLTLRIPRQRTAELAALEGVVLHLGECTVRLGAPQARELIPYGTLYAHLVAADDADEARFLDAMEANLAALGVTCRAICGRRQVIDGGSLQGFSLMLDGLSTPASMRVLEAGLGAHRRLGCGLFVPHKSAAAVGST
jgi:CRISPR-associated protein Cas6